MKLLRIIINFFREVAKEEFRLSKKGEKLWNQMK